MAKSISPLIELRGDIAGLTSRKTKFGNIAGKKTGPKEGTVLTNDSFDLTRRNAGEFSFTTKDATLLRRAMGDALLSVQRSSLNGATIGLLHRVAQGDTTSTYGFRH